MAGRASPLSQVQIDEVEQELRAFSPAIRFERRLVPTTGDRDLKTSLRTLGKTDFFTRELDALLLGGECDVAIHSAKDLPDPLPAGLKVIALTSGVDPSDALVLRPGETLSSLKSGAVIATSSERREEVVRELRRDLTFIDLRGTIGQRLKKLEAGQADGVVVATAALIRLKLTHLNYIKLPGSTVPMQGQLAVVARENDAAMQQLFEPLDTR